MKTHSSVLKEWNEMNPLQKSSYITKHGKALVTNAATFLEVDYSGIDCQAAGLDLYNKFNDADGTPETENPLKTADELVVAMLNANCLSVENRAQGDGDIIVLAAMKAT